MSFKLNKCGNERALKLSVTLNHLPFDLLLQALNDHLIELGLRAVRLTTGAHLRLRIHIRHVGTRPPRRRLIGSVWRVVWPVCGAFWGTVREYLRRQVLMQFLLLLTL